MSTGLQVDIVEVWIYENDPIAVELGELVTNVMPKPLRLMHYGNVHEFMGDVEQMRDYPDQVRFAVLASTECTNVSFAQKKQFEPGCTGLHAPPSTTHHAFYEGTQRLQKIRGVGHVMVFQELPQCQHAADQQLLTRQMGKATMVDAGHWGDAKRVRYFCSNPLLPPGNPEIRPKMYGVRSVDRIIANAYQWTPLPLAREKAQQRPTVLRRYFPRLLHEKASQQRVLDPYELLTCDSMLFLHQPSGETQYGGVDVFLDHMGLHETPLCRIKEKYPCLKLINKFGLIAQGTDVKQSCGKTILCTACTDCIKYLDAGWHLYSATEVMYQVIWHTLNSWTSVGSSTWKEYTEQPHRCSDLCVHRPKWAKGKADPR